MRSILNKISNSHGMTLVETMIGGGLLMIAIAASFTALQAMLDRQRAGDLTMGVLKYQVTLIASLQSSDAVSKTAAANGINCLMTRQACAVGAGTNFSTLSVYDHQGNLLSDGVNANVGFDKDGAVCTTFPSQSCPYRYSVEWRAHCVQGVDCSSPLFQAKGTLVVSDEVKAGLNPAKFGFLINLGQIMGNYEQACTSMGGTYVAADPPRCAMSLNGPCPTMAGAKQVVFAFDKTTGTKQCRPLFWDISCGANEVMVGVRADGSVDCRPMRFTCSDGRVVTDMSRCVVAPLPCQVDPTLPMCITGGGDGGGDGGGGGGDGGCGGDGGAGDGCGP